MDQRRHGKIERPWRKQWQRFEKIFYIVDNWFKLEITMTEMNQRFKACIVKGERHGPAR